MIKGYFFNLRDKFNYDIGSVEFYYYSKNKNLNINNIIVNQSFQEQSYHILLYYVLNFICASQMNIDNLTIEDMSNCASHKRHIYTNIDILFDYDFTFRKTFDKHNTVKNYLQNNEYFKQIKSLKHNDISLHIKEIKKNRLIDYPLQFDNSIIFA
jgi:hypothetical protein